MSSATETGELSVRCEYFEFEWTIKDIFSYICEDTSCFSPSFSIPGSAWHFLLFPNRETGKRKMGYFSLYLCRRRDSTYPKNVNFSFGLKRADGSIEKEVNASITHVFSNEGTSFGTPRFLNRSVLMQRKFELAPSGNLTVICTLHVNGSYDYTSRLIKISKDLEDMFLSNRDCDTTLRVKKKKYSVNKSVLKSRSPVFAAMFEVDMKEKNTSVVDIEDSDPSAFRDFLVFLYSGRFENTSNKVHELYKIAHKYIVEELMSECLHCMLNSLSVDTVLEAALLGHEFDEDELKSKSHDFFNRNFAEIITTDKWSLFLKENHNLADKMLKNMAANMKWEKK